MRMDKPRQMETQMMRHMIATRDTLQKAALAERDRLAGVAGAREAGREQMAVLASPLALRCVHARSAVSH